MRKIVWLAKITHLLQMVEELQAPYDLKSSKCQNVSLVYM